MGLTNSQLVFGKSVFVSPLATHALTLDFVGDNQVKVLRSSFKSEKGHSYGVSGSSGLNSNHCCSLWGPEITPPAFPRARESKEARPGATLDLKQGLQRPNRE